MHRPTVSVARIAVARVARVSVVAALSALMLAAGSSGCGTTAVGDPCTPEDEFKKTQGSFEQKDLTIDVNSTSCETRVCLVHYFRGRVTCPFGNNNESGQAGKCTAVPGKPGLYTLDGTSTGKYCCPLLGDLEQNPVQLAVEPQCKGRQAVDAVYCSCRCDVPDDPDIDPGQVSFCPGLGRGVCPKGFTCQRLCDSKTGGCGLLPKGKWGSYCIKDSQVKITGGDSVSCGADYTP